MEIPAAHQGRERGPVQPPGLPQEPPAGVGLLDLGDGLGMVLAGDRGPQDGHMELSQREWCIGAGVGLVPPVEQCTEYGLGLEVAEQVRPWDPETPQAGLHSSRGRLGARRRDDAEKHEGRMWVGGGPEALIGACAEMTLAL